jgi:hypothetical protein
MTPKEKAIELVDKMKYPVGGVYIISHIANELALIAVDEILKITWVDKFLTLEDYWNEVKHEIEKL